MPDLEDDMIDVQDSFKVNDQNNLIEQCSLREKKYGENFSMITSYERALGKGYLFNADMHPDILKSWWDKETKYKEIFKDFLYYEHVFDREHHDHLICLSCGKIIEFSNPEIEILQDNVCNRHDFTPSEHVLKISGLCKNCK